MTLEPGIGAALVLLFLADIFLTVLYARAGTGLLAPHWIRAIWAAFRAAASLFGRRRGVLLSRARPASGGSVLGVWALGLTIGSALIVRPELGTAIRPSSGATPTDFVTALLVAGNSLSIVGGGDYAPHTAATRLLFLVNSLIGASVLSLVLSYLVQVYSALRERNALALTIDLMTDGTGDAAVMLARLIPHGDAQDATSELGNLVRALAATKEAHHFYPLLFYFRFEDPRYAVSRFSMVLLDLVTLIDTALDRHRYAALIASAPVASLRRGARLLLETLDAHFPTARGDTAPDDWPMRRSFVAATATLAQARVAVQADGIDAYVTLRQQWEPLAARVAPTLGYAMSDIDRRSATLGEDGGACGSASGA
ncbi:MAG: ion channel [Sphingomonas sp.]